MKPIRHIEKDAFPVKLEMSVEMAEELLRACNTVAKEHPNSWLEFHMNYLATALRQWGVFVGRDTLTTDFWPHGRLIIS